MTRLEAASAEQAEAIRAEVRAEVAPEVPDRRRRANATVTMAV